MSSSKQIESQITYKTLGFSWSGKDFWIVSNTEIPLHERQTIPLSCLILLWPDLRPDPPLSKQSVSCRWDCNHSDSLCLAVGYSNMETWSWNLVMSHMPVDEVSCGLDSGLGEDFFLSICISQGVACKYGLSILAFESVFKTLNRIAYKILRRENPEYLCRLLLLSETHCKKDFTKFLCLHYLYR